MEEHDSDQPHQDDANESGSSAGVIDDQMRPVEAESPTDAQQDKQIAALDKGAKRRENVALGIAAFSVLAALISAGVAILQWRVMFAQFQDAREAARAASEAAAVQSAATNRQLQLTEQQLELTRLQFSEMARQTAVMNEQSRIASRAFASENLAHISISMIEPRDIKSQELPMNVAAAISNSGRGDARLGFLTVAWAVSSTEDEPETGVFQLIPGRTRDLDIASRGGFTQSFAFQDTETNRTWFDQVKSGERVLFLRYSMDYTDTIGAWRTITVHAWNPRIKNWSIKRTAVEAR